MNVNTGELFRFSTDEELLQAQTILKDKLVPISEEEYNEYSSGILPEYVSDEPDPKAKAYKELKIRCKRTRADKNKKSRRKIAKESRRRNR